MAVRARKLNNRQALTSAARDWLDGKQCGFFRSKSQDELSSSCAEHGNDDDMFWRSRYCLPITRETLEEHENSWLASGEGDEYGRASCFIDAHYSDDEKSAL
jgi:hypothetical protein